MSLRGREVVLYATSRQRPGGGINRLWVEENYEASTVHSIGLEAIASRLEAIAIREALQATNPSVGCAQWHRFHRNMHDLAAKHAEACGFAVGEPGPTRSAFQKVDANTFRLLLS